MKTAGVAGISALMANYWQRRNLQKEWLEQKSKIKHDMQAHEKEAALRIEKAVLSSYLDRMLSEWGNERHVQASLITKRDRAIERLQKLRLDFFSMFQEKPDLAWRWAMHSDHGPLLMKILMTAS